MRLKKLQAKISASILLSDLSCPPFFNTSFTFTFSLMPHQSSYYKSLGASSDGQSGWSSDETQARDTGKVRNEVRSNSEDDKVQRVRKPV